MSRREPLLWLLLGNICYRRMQGVEHHFEPGGRSGPEAGRSAVRTVRAYGPDGPRMRRAV
jgi:hypothetical protein